MFFSNSDWKPRVGYHKISLDVQILTNLTWSAKMNRNLVEFASWGSDPKQFIMHKLLPAKPAFPFVAGSTTTATATATTGRSLGW